MNYSLIHEGYADPRLYEPLQQLESALNLRQLSHVDHEAGFPVNRCSETIYSLGGRGLLLKATVYPEHDYPEGYLRDVVEAKFLLSVETSSGREIRPQRLRVLEEKVRTVMIGAGATEIKSQ